MYENEIFICPNCGGEMEYDETALMNLECPECGAEGLVNFDIEGHVDMCEDYSYEDIYEDPEENMPDCCKSCGCGAYPSCMTSCKIFDD